MKNLNVFKKIMLIPLVLMVFSISNSYSQANRLINNLIETETISEYKKAKENIEKIVATDIKFENLTENQYKELKKSYERVQASFDGFVNTISSDLKSKDSLNSMKAAPLIFLDKYDKALYVAMKTFNEDFMGTYDNIVLGGNSKSIWGFVLKTAGEPFVKLLVDVGKDIAVDIIVNKFVKPLLLPNWNDIVQAPLVFEDDNVIQTTDPELPIKPNPFTVEENSNSEYENKVDRSVPVINTIEGEIMFVSQDPSQNFDFLWYDSQGKPKRIEATGGVNVINSSLSEGDYFISKQEIPADFNFQIHVKTNSPFSLFALNLANEEIVLAYPLSEDQKKSVSATGGTITITSDDFISFPLDNNYFFTSGNDKYDYIVLLFTNSQIDFNMLCSQILSESSNEKDRIYNAIKKNGFIVNENFEILEQGKTIRFKSDVDETAVLPLLFVIDREK